MSALTIEHGVTASPTLRRAVDAPSRRLAAPARPTRGPGRRTGPAARPGQTVEAPTLRRPAQHRSAQARVQACRAEAAISSPAVWRLTDRGIAVILTVTVMIVFAALTVVGLTALRVTSPSYQPYGQSQLVQR